MLRDLPLLIPALVALPTPAQDPATDHRRTPIVRVIEQAKPAVVSITTNKLVRVNYGLFTGQKEIPGEGTGVVIFEDGYVITNWHVVKGAEQITVRFDEVDDARAYRAEVVSFVPEEDLALLKILGGETFPTIPMCETDPIHGETVIAIGNAYGNSHTVSTGIISGLDRPVKAEHMEFQDLLQTDAAINPGNSGGPLLTIDGELIGINTAVTQRAENIGFAIPVARVRAVLYKELMSIDKARAWLGFDTDESFHIRTIYAGSPGATAGLQEGDRIVAIDDERIESQASYNLARLAITPLQPTTIRVDREGKLYDATFTAVNWWDGVNHEKLGMTVEQTRLGRRYQAYLKVASVDPEGPAASVGIQPGDIIAAVKLPGIGTKRPHKIEDLAVLVYRAGPGAPMEIEVWRDDNGNGSYEHTEFYSEVYTGQLDLR